LTSTINQLLPAFTSLALLVSCVPKGVFGADGTSGSIKVRISLGTFNTFFEFDVVDLIFGAFFAQFFSVVKVLRVEAFNTFLAIVVKQRVLTFAFFSYCVILSAIVTILALIVCFVVTLVGPTLNTPFAIEKGFLSWTKNASF